jgi:pimeloyl-ACP methyl ester carboxylesterase
MWTQQLCVLPGSTVAPVLYPLRDSLVDWAQAVLSIVNDGPHIVVGCSVGGSCALEMARLAPDRVEALVLLGSKASVRPDSIARDRYVAAIRDGGPRRIWQETEALCFGPSANPGAVRAAKKIALDQDSDDLIRGTRIFHDRRDASDVVRRWRKPLVVVVGDEDQLSAAPVENADQLAKSAPFGRLHVMRGCGHFANLERPTEFNDIVNDVIYSTAIDHD